ncbi:MAG: hypothetical protein QM499_03715 [Flavobacteriaceae bacterium]
MKITFQTKEESNQKQLEEFLSLSGAERISRFLNLMEQVSRFPTKYRKEQKDNFIIRLYKDNELGK